MVVWRDIWFGLLSVARSSSFNLINWLVTCKVDHSKVCKFVQICTLQNVKGNSRENKTYNHRQSPINEQTI